MIKQLSKQEYIESQCDLLKEMQDYFDFNAKMKINIRVDLKKYNNARLLGMGEMIAIVERHNEKLTKNNEDE